MKKILICIGSYLPGTKAGGPIKSISNLVTELENYYDIYIYTSDRDVGDKKPYNDIITDQWIKSGKHQRYYYSSLTCRKTKSMVLEGDFDLIYLTGFFSILTIKTLLAVSLVKKKRILLAPRGDFAASALDKKKIKKYTYILLFKLFLNNNDIIWQATSFEEKEDIIKIIKNANVELVPNLGTRNNTVTGSILKEKGKIKIVFMSRVSKIKNLDYAIKLLSEIEGDIEFDIYGPIEDKDYWEKCKMLIQHLPNNICVNYRKVLNHDEIFYTLSKYHIFLLPTQGENFGHAIYEAMSSGCIPVISNTTPWKELKSKKVGWDIDLSLVSEFKSIIQYCVNLNQKDYLLYRENLLCYIKEYNEKDKTIEKMKKIIG